jgi:hypothetical protein
MVEEVGPIMAGSQARDGLIIHVAIAIRAGCPRKVDVGDGDRIPPDPVKIEDLILSVEDMVCPQGAVWYIVKVMFVLLPGG